MAYVVLAVAAAGIRHAGPQRCMTTVIQQGRLHIVGWVLEAGSHNRLCCDVCVSAGQPLSSAQRRRFYDKPSNLEGTVFSTEYVYTFVIEQSIVDMESYRCALKP